MLTSEQVERLEALLQKATPGPWKRDYGNDTGPNDDYFIEWQEAGPAQVRGRNQDADADLIAEAISALPALLQLARAVSDSPQARVYVIGTGEGEDLLTLEPRDRQDREAIRASVGTVALVPVPVKEG